MFFANDLTLQTTPTRRLGRQCLERKPSPRAHATEPMAALSLSDAGWAGTLVCGGLLLVVRLLRDQLRALEQRENTSLASVLTQRLWRFSPARLRQLGVLLQIQHGASVLLSGAFLGCWRRAGWCTGQAVSHSHRVQTHGQSFHFTGPCVFFAQLQH